MTHRSARLMLLFLTACARESPEPSALTPLIELRIAHQVAAPELQPVEYEGRTFYLETRSVVADDDLELVQPSVRGNTLTLQLRPTPEGAARMQKATSENIGKHLAVLLDSRVRNIPVIQSAIGGPARSVSTEVELAAGEAERIAKRIRLRWPQPK